MTEDGCKPIFKLVPVESKAKSREAGRPIFEEREYVEIIIPGSKNERPVRRVTDNDRERWPEAYRRFKEGLEEASEGTPLEQWPRMSRSRVHELKAVGIRSVEDLAAVQDNNLSNIGPDARELRDHAKRFLSSSDDEAQTEALHKRIAELEEQLERLEDENEELRKNQKRKPGPKPKEDAA